MKTWVLAIVMAVVAIAPVFYVLYHTIGVRVVTVSTEADPSLIEFEPKTKPVVIEPGVELRVRSCRVVDGYVFDLFVEGDQWIRVQLPVATRDDATSYVVELLRAGKGAGTPTVILKRQVGEFWIVDLIVIVEGKKVNLKELLREKNLLF